MKKSHYYVIGALVAFLGVWFFFLRSDAGTAAGDVVIEESQVEIGDVAKLVSASGSVRALTTVEVGSQVSGQIVELNADFNSEVKSGDVIARIDPQTFESRVASASADVQSARASLAVQQANIASAEATLAQAEKDYARQTALFEADAVAQSTLEDNERALAVARANLDVGRAQLRSSNASLSQRLASLKSAQVDLERTIIRSPIDGVVISRNVDVGQTVAASFSAPVLFTIAQDLDDIRIDAAVVEGDIGGINSGDAVKFTVDAYPDQAFEGTVEQVRLASEALQNVVTYTVVIAAENRNGRLLPGMTANVEITVDNREGVLRIADAAVRFRPPANGPEVLEAEATERGERRPEGARTGGGRGEQMLEGLDIDAERSARIQDAMRTAMRELRASSGGNSGMPVDRNAMRQRFQAVRNKVLAEYLTPEEMKKLKALQSQRPTTVQVDAYVQTVDGKLQKRPLVIGLQDGAFAEVIRGAEEGDSFVTRVLVSQKEN